ncbi:hypothetical protein FNJ84_11290 [Paracoccus sp. M683]|uniref:YjhX family toxin n=1 Tax=Paracoccus sp. M683 TaxID=2594268 RepID=UPI00117E2664|nr:YjhX family toxin [Paracoccus sp. M683]TRW96658.1 hypothetical protein FNJ84_11290 [Paracoccus sp. M683]
MNISKREQRVLHVLAQGGCIRHLREDDRSRRITGILCMTRDGALLADCDLDLFGQLRSRRLIGSLNGEPYRITRKGRLAVRAQADNR